MKEYLFHHGRQFQLNIRTEEGSGNKILVKSANPDTASRSANLKLLNEYEIVKNLDIKFVRKVLGFEKSSNNPLLLLEFIEGNTLATYFNDGFDQLAECLQIAIEMVDAVEAIHRERIIHKNLTPANILITQFKDRIKLIDFGNAGKIDLKWENLSNPDKLQGDLRYISPEQTGRMDRVVDHRTDLYSLGVIFYEMLTGMLPFEGETPLELVHAHLAIVPVNPDACELNYKVRQRPKVPLVLSSIIMHLLAKDPQERYKSANGLKYDLNQCLQHLQPDGRILNFQLFNQDFSDRFSLPEKLYGMDTEVAFLNNLFNETGKGLTSVVMITGYSGVGKSALVRALHKELSGKNGFFVSGKFNQLNKNIPNSAFIDAFIKLVDYIQSDDEIQLEKWKEKILNALGGLGKVLTNLIPNLEQLIGPQLEVPELSTVEAQNRLEFLMREFVKCMTDNTHPLLIFIDDLQWADEASMVFMKQLCIDSSIQGLLLIGTYRNNEVDASHPLYMTLKAIDAERKIHEIEVKNLAIASINQLVADTLSYSLLETAALTEIIAEKTGGNAFFVFQFLKSLYENGNIQFSHTSNKWEWNDDRIKAMRSTDNVVDLLTNSLNQLPVQTIEALKIAACIGTSFHVKLLSTILEAAPSICFAQIEIAIVKGFISPIYSQEWNLSFVTDEVAKELEFSFVHDKIQQAVYGLIPTAEKDALHLRIGRLLLADKNKEVIQAQIFQIVNQLNHGINLIATKEERQNLAELNLSAGKRAMQSAAYGQGLFYFETGINLLEEQPWNNQYHLCLNLFAGAAESAFLSANPERMELFVSQTLAHAKNILDKIPVYNTLVDAYTAGQDLPKAIEAGLEALKALGVHFPSNPNMAHIFVGLGKTKMMLAGKKVEQLIDLPEMKDPYILQAMPLLERISPAAYMSGSKLFPLIVFRMVDLSLKYGNSSLSAFGYASFAITLSGVLGDYDGGFRFVEMSKKLLEKYHDEVYKVKVYFVNYCFVRHWKLHANTMAEPLMEAYRSGLMAGNLFSGNWVACYALTWNYFTAKPLGDLKNNLKSFTGTFRQLKQYGAFNLSDILLHTVNRLTDPENITTVFGDETINEEAILQRCFTANDKTAVFFFHLNQMQICYLFGDYVKAMKFADEAAPYLEAVTGLHYIPLYHFYRTLIILANPASHAKELNSVKASIKLMKGWSKHAPMNYLHKYYLMKAEWAVRNKANDAARECFDHAILNAKSNGFVQEEAIALECAAVFYKKLGVTHLYNSLYKEMLKAYTVWGAVAKLKQLGLKKIIVNQDSQIGKLSTTYEKELVVEEMMDLESVLKASSILAGEIDTERLMVGFMRIMIQNSGADRGVLLLSNEGKWYVRAGVSVNATEVEMVEIPMNGLVNENRYAIPQTVIRFCLNSKKAVTINNTGLDHEFKKDPYFMDKKGIAILCLPILNQSNLVGVVYLENSLIHDVFSEERIGVLNIIGSQFGVTLENIRLYQHTMKLNLSYEKFVPKQFLAHLNKNSIIDVKLGDHIQQDMTIMFMDIRGFTKLSEQMTPKENFLFINDFLSRLEPVISKYGGFIDKYIGDAIMALFPESTDKAMEAGSAMLIELQKFNIGRNENHLAPIRIGIGLHTGTIMLGTIGGKERMDTTVISDAVNIASRVQGVNKEYATSMLVTETTLSRVLSPGSIHKRRIGEVSLYGKENRITIFEIYNSDNANNILLKDQTLDEFQEAVSVYESGDKALAAKHFEKIVTSNPNDETAKKFLQLCVVGKGI